jgi:hypothetical protein
MLVLLYYLTFTDPAPRDSRGLPFLWRVNSRSADPARERHRSAAACPVCPSWTSFHNLAARDVVSLGSRNRHLVARRGRPHHLTLVRTTNRPARRHFASFGHLILNRDSQVGESAVAPRYRSFDALGSHFPSLAGRIVDDKLGVGMLIYHIRIPLVKIPSRKRRTMALFSSVDIGLCLLSSKWISVATTSNGGRSPITTRDPLHPSQQHEN